MNIKFPGIDLYPILSNKIEDNSYRLRTNIVGNDFYKTYCIYDDNKIECTVFKNHKRIIEVDVVLDMLETNYINIETKLLNASNQNEVNYIAKNMIRPLLNESLA